MALNAPKASRATRTYSAALAILWGAARQNLGIGKSGLTEGAFEHPGSTKAERAGLP